MRRDWSGPRFLYRYDNHPRTHKPQWEAQHELDEWWELEQEPPTHWFDLPPLPPEST